MNSRGVQFPGLRDGSSISTSGRAALRILKKTAVSSVAEDASPHASRHQAGKAILLSVLNW